jgi:hypothetical protein
VKWFRSSSRHQPIIFCEAVELRNIRSLHQLEPEVQRQGRLGAILALEDLAQGLLESPGLGDLGKDLEDCRKTRDVLVAQVVGGSQQREAAAEQAAGPAARGTRLASLESGANPIQGVVGGADDVELVHHHRRLGQDAVDA